MRRQKLRVARGKAPPGKIAQAFSSHAVGEIEIEARLICREGLEPPDILRGTQDIEVKVIDGCGDVPIIMMFDGFADRLNRAGDLHYL